MELVSDDQVRLAHYVEGDGHPVVLLHGFSSSTSGAWRKSGTWDRLVAAGMQVIGLDARGHGRSDKPHQSSAYGGQAMVRDVEVLFDALGLDGADLVGYSMGSVTAMHFAAGSTRVRRLVLGGIGGHPTTWQSMAASRARKAKGERVVAALQAPDPGDIPHRDLQRMRRLVDIRCNDLVALAAIAQTYNVSLGGEIDVQRITVPTLVVCGDQDAAPDELASALPRATWKVVRGGHDSCMANREFANVIIRFLSSDSG